MKLEYFKRTLKHHTDPNHGWVGVSLAELYLLGIIDSISKYSYIGTDCKGHKTVYLEEDCDLGLYLEKLESLGIEFIIEDGTYTNRAHWIRSLPHYNLARK